MWSAPRRPQDSWVVAAANPLVSGASVDDGQVVVDARHPGGGPGGPDGLVVLRPVAHDAGERDRAVRRGDVDVAVAELRVADERGVDPIRHVLRRRLVDDGD